MVFEGFTHLDEVFTMNIDDKKYLGDNDDINYEKAEKNLEELKDELKSRHIRYRDSNSFDSDEERLEHILKSGADITLARKGGLFLKVPITEELQNHSAGAYELLTASEIPSHMEIHAVKFHQRKDVVSVQLSDRS